MRLYFTGLDSPGPAIGRALHEIGWQVVHMPFRRAVFLKADLPDPRIYDGWIMTSKRAVDWFLTQEISSPPRLAVVGETSSHMLRAFPLFFPENIPVNAASLLAGLRTRFPRGGRFLFIRGESALNTIPDGLDGYQLDQLMVYRTEKVEKTHSNYLGGMVYFQAPSTVTDFLEQFGGSPEWTGAIGETTARALQKLNWKVHFRPSRPELRYLVEELPDPKTLIARFREHG